MLDSQTEMPPLALDVRELGFSYGTKKTLDRVSLQVPAGHVTALLGLNGAGKTTLFSLITGLYSTPLGSIGVFGFDIRRAPGEALRRIGVVFQARTLDLDLTVRQNLHYHAALHGLGQRETCRRTDELLNLLGLTDAMMEKARRLSGGQMRRVEIARALLHRPALLLLDEPTVGLDIESRADVAASIRQLVSLGGVGVLWATHLLDEVEASDHVVVMKSGRIVAQGAVGDVILASGQTTLAGAFSKLCDVGPREGTT